jgi:predicted PurR-regulated permease PerM
MSIPVTKQAAFWGVASLILFVFIWMFKSVLTPFVLGVVIAYLLNPLVKGFSTKGIGRSTSSAFIICLFFILATTVIVLVAPIVAKESADLIDALPGYLDKLFKWAQPHTLWLQENFGENYMGDAKAFLKDNISKVLKVSGGIAGGLAAGGQALVGAATTLVLTPLVAFYMMREWPVITQWVEDLIPRSHETVIKNLLTQIDGKLAGFIRGQLTVAFLLGIIYAVALTVAGLNYGFLIGIGAGLLSIIPMVGSTIGLLVSVAVAWFQSGEVQYVLIIAAIFIVGQVVEGNVLSPKLLGDSVGLHPLWILFALMAGGSLLGILGMLIAVPVAAVIGVLVSFAILQYKHSSLYKQKEQEAANNSSKKTAKKSKAKKVT